MSSFPAVATVIGISQEVADSGPLLATLAIDPSIVVSQPPPPPEPLEIKIGDPVTQAVVDNIIGKLPTKKEPVLLKCEVCNVTVSSEEVLQTHYAGGKHARKLIGQELFKEIAESPDSTFIVTGRNGINSNFYEFTCKICNIRVNSHQQLQQHLTGTKHKNKAGTSKSNTMQMSFNGGSNEDRGVVNVDIGPNRLYCAACNVCVNSDLQLHQHITSIKHANKVNGRTQPVSVNRSAPYTRRPATSWGNKQVGDADKNSYNLYGNKKVNRGWSPSSYSMGLGNVRPTSFVSGGTLFDK